MRPGEKAHAIIPEPVLDNILIPLDGSALAEQVLETALDLAQLMDARYSLLRVIQSRSSPDPSERGGPPDTEQPAMYLERIAGGLRQQGLQVQTKVVVARHAAEAILEEAAAQASNLIALATHGRGGLKRLLLGSVADNLLRAAPAPDLVYNPTGKEL